MKNSAWILGIILVVSPLTGRTQGYVDQKAIAGLQQTMDQGSIAAPAGWHTYVVSPKLKKNKDIVAAVQAYVDSLPGALPSAMRMQVVELSNRVVGKYIQQRPELLVPNAFPDNFLAYAPYPFLYAAADTIPKLFIIDKYTQTFGAYEAGRLVRWGLVSTGIVDDNTPNGRFTFNWRDAERYSTAAPPGEQWLLRWVWNFQASRGIHVHQYALPIAQPASHGCVRLSEADARWNFDWSNKGTMVLVLNHAPIGLAQHWMPGPDGATSLVSLPEDPWTVPDGHDQELVQAGGW